MEVLTSKIIKVTGNGKWDGPNGTLYKFEVEFENHDIGGVMTKELDQKRWVVGETIGYTKEVKGNFTNFKRVDEKPKTGFGGNPNYQRAPFNPAADKERQVMIILQSCLSQSNQFHLICGYSDKAQDVGAKLKETWATAEWFAKKILDSPLLVQPAQSNGNATAEIDKLADQQKLDAIRNSAKPF